MSHAKPGKVLSEQASDTAKSDDPDAASCKLCLASLSKHPELTVVSIYGIDQMRSGRWREATNRVTNHNSFIETETVVRRKPEVHLNGSSAKDESANRDTSGNLQQGRITALMRF